jgi:predicted nucleic acid-binding protein
MDMYLQPRELGICVMIKVYLDSNVIMSILDKTDANLAKILKASREGKILAYVSWLSITEISRSVSTTSKDVELRTQISETLRKSKIHILSSFDRSLSSGSAWATTNNIDYSDHLHLLIAKRAKVNFFVTYDYELLSIREFDSIAILNPDIFVSKVLRSLK